MDSIIEDVKNRVDHLQQEDIPALREEISEIKVALNTNDFLTQQTIKSNEKLSNTMDTLKETMIEISTSVRESNKISQQLANTVDELNNKVCSVEENTNKTLDNFSAKIYELDNKSKIDFLQWIKSNFIGVVLLIGALGYAIHQIVQ